MPSSAKPWDAIRAQDIIASHAGYQGALLPLLQAIQIEFACVPEQVVPLVAKALNLSRAEIHGVLTFYPDFKRSAPVGPVIRLCVAEACQARGGRQVQARLEAVLGCKIDGSVNSMGVALEAVYCLGLCASGPAAIVDGKLAARLEGVRLERLIERISA